jgi:[protein-PII] uridylyltransferase
MNDVGFALRSELRAERALLIAEFKGGGRVEKLLHGLTRCVDRTLAQLARSQGIVRRVAIVAVGGYGRGELFPHSDIDIVIVLPDDAEPSELSAVETLVGMLWDLGLHVGHSVRTAAQCREDASRDVTVLTSMIEARRVAGPTGLFNEFAKNVSQATDPQHFFREKVLEQQQRHLKYQEAAYSLEPNCKESPGGLRDLHTLLWVAGAAGLGKSWSDLIRGGLLTEEEGRWLRRSERTLKQLRARLHVVAERREDRLVFDVQGAIAEAEGLRHTAARRASEVLMQRYYRAAKLVTQLNAIVLQNIEERLFPRQDPQPQHIDSAFVARGEMLDIADDRVFDREPDALLRGFLVLQQHPGLKGMSARLLRALWHTRFLINAQFRRSPVNRATFIAILQQPRGVVHALRAMNQWSVLGRYLPVFRRIVGQMQHDLFHVYTVDQHILQVVRNLRRFTMSEYAHEYPLCSQLIADFDRPWLLYVAALFHDIAKGRGGDHSELGARDARVFCRQHGILGDDAALVDFLVAQHLTMSQVAQKQDIADPEVVGRFALLAGTERRLTALYLLTVADVRGTSPRVWTSWKGKLLEDLFRMTRRRLGGDALPAVAVLERRRADARRILDLYGISATAHEPLWGQLDVVYFMRNSAREIAWHTRTLLAHVSTGRAIVRTRLSVTGDAVEVLLYVRDQKDLFARVCGYFDSRSLSILDARIHTTRHGYALDSFLVTDHGRTDYRQLLSQVHKQLTDWIEAITPLPPPVKGRLSRHSRHFPVAPNVTLAAGERGRQYLLSITTTDRIGLLYAITRVLATHDVNVHTAKINTLGERVEDVFLVDGAVLNDEREQTRLERDLLDAISP